MSPCTDHSTTAADDSGGLAGSSPGRKPATPRCVFARSFPLISAPSGVEAYMQIVPALSLVALATALATSTTLLRAQQAATDNASRLTLAVVDSMPVATARAMVVRKADGPTLLVLDRRHATPETLGLALAVVKQVRRTPLAPGAQQVIPIQGGVATKAPSARRMAFLRAQLNSLYAKPVSPLGPLGRGRFMEFSDTELGR